MDDLRAFNDFATQRMNSTALDLSSGAKDVALFNDSLQSAMVHVRLNEAPKDIAGEPLNLVAGYLEKLIPNAVADQVDGTHFMAMNTPLFVAVQEFAMFCFTQRDFFPDIGDPSLELSPSPIGDRVPGLWLLDHTKKGGHVTDEHQAQIVPRGQSRYVASIYLGMLMARFVWLHEFQHCFAGHVRFAQEKGLALRLYEIAEPMAVVDFAKKSDQQNRVKADSRRDDTLRCLELDADKNAFWTLCQIQLRDRENVEGIAALALDLRLRLSLFGAYAMTWLFEEFQTYIEAQHGRTHPEPFLRLQHLVRTAEEYVTPVHPDVGRCHEDACGQFTRIKNVIPSFYETDDLYRSAHDTSVRSTLTDYEGRLESIRPEFYHFRFVAPSGQPESR